MPGLWVTTLALLCSPPPPAHILPSLRAQFPVFLPYPGPVGLEMGGDSQPPSPTWVWQGTERGFEQKGQCHTLLDIWGLGSWGTCM